jgi:hypothetical protein
MRLEPGVLALMMSTAVRASLERRSVDETAKRCVYLLLKLQRRGPPATIHRRAISFTTEHILLRLFLKSVREAECRPINVAQALNTSLSYQA